MGVAARLPDRLRQGAGRGRRLAADRGHGLHHASPTPTRPRPPSSPPASTTSASGSSPPAGPRRRSRAMGVPVTAINKIGEGSPHVVDYIRDGEVDMVINTPTGSRRARRRLRDPQRRGAPRDPLHHDDDRRLGRGAGDLRRSASGERRAALAAGAPRRLAAARRPSARRGATGCSAPFGRRDCEVVANEATGGYRIFSALDRAGPSPARASSTCSPRERLGRRRAGRPVPAAGLLGRRRPSRADGGVRLDFLLEAVGPGHRAARRARAGRAAAGSPGRSGGPFSAPAELAPGAAGAILVGGGIGVAPLAILRRQLAERGVAAARRCSASATAPTRAGSSSSTARRCGSPARTATPATGATSPTCSR